MTSELICDACGKEIKEKSNVMGICKPCKVKVDGC